jgi:hypothetical protein
MNIPEIITDKKLSKEDKVSLTNKIKSIKRNLYSNIEIIYVITNTENKAEYNNNSLILNSEAEVRDIYRSLGSSLLQNNMILKEAKPEFETKLSLWKERCSFLRCGDSEGNLTTGIFLDPSDRLSFQVFIENSFQFFVENRKQLAIVNPKTYKVIEKLHK